MKTIAALVVGGAPVVAAAVYTNLGLALSVVAVVIASWSAWRVRTVAAKVDAVIDPQSGRIRDLSADVDHAVEKIDGGD